MNTKIVNRIAFAAGCLVLATAATPLQAAPACGPHQKVTKALTGKFKESRKGWGLAGGKQLMEIFVSKKGTWTVVITNPAGLSCVVAVGDSWEEAPKVAEGSPT